MNIQTFFLKHPVYALILNIFILVVGALSYTNLSIREYPDVAVPKLTIRTSLQNASAESVETDITFPMEAALAGVSGLEELRSESHFGRNELTLSFKAGTNLDTAMSMVRDKLSSIQGAFPRDTTIPSLSKEDSAEQPFFWLFFASDAFSYPELTHYIKTHIENSLKNIKGVASIVLYGQPYEVSIKLDPLKLAQFQISPSEVIQAMEKHKYSYPGGLHKDETQIFLKIRPESLEDFANILLKQHKENFVYLKDIAQISLDHDTNFRVRINQAPGVILGVVQTSAANPLAVSDALREKLDFLRTTLPPSIQMNINYDKSDFIRASLDNIQHAILEAVIFVLIIIFLFLRSFRASLIPMVTIPIALIGAFFVIFLFGYSINVITLLAMVLVTGLVVDDAVVVVENVHRHMENGLSPWQATLKGGKEISFAIVAMTLTLASVYIPLAFSDSTLNQLFIEFAVTLSGAVILSGIIALTLTPVMCGYLPKSKEREFFPSISRGLSRLDILYEKTLRSVVRKRKWLYGLGLFLLGAAYLLFSILPPELTPPEDRGVIGLWIPPMGRVSMDEFNDYVTKLEAKSAEIPHRQSMLSIFGPWGGNLVLPLVDWHERPQSAAALKNQLEKLIQSVPTVTAYAWSYDNGLPGADFSQGSSNEIPLYIQSTESHESLFHTMETLKKEFSGLPFVQDVRHDLKLNQQSFHAQLNKKELARLGLDYHEVSHILQLFFGGIHKTKFLKDTVQYDVKLKGNKEIESLTEIPLVTKDGKETNLASIAALIPTTIPETLRHYNQLRSSKLTITLKDGTPLGNAIAKITNANIIPKTVRYDWGGVAKIYSESQSSMYLLIFLGLVFIYGILAIQFESFIDPFIIILTVPLAFFGALLLLWITGQSFNILSQIGLLTLIGLITKHGILLVNFANQYWQEKGTAIEAAIAAGKVRLRPILMTTGAMILGILPLILSTGAGAEARRVIGLTLIGGLFFGTFLTLFFIPCLYIPIKGWTKRKKEIST